MFPILPPMPRILIVGFDGANLDLCERWMDEGRMPNLASICAGGSFGELRSTIPSNSAVAWTSLSTGADPGRHGIFDFVLPRSGGYGYRVATREDRRVPAMWTYATKADARCAVINIPMTFPAERVAFMVSGMDAPGLDQRSVSPAGGLDRLRSASPEYRIMSKAAHEAEGARFEAAERELIDVLAARGRFVAELARPRDLDFLMVNLEATDGAQHFFWQHHDPSHPRHDPSVASPFRDTIGRVYEASDRELGRLLEIYSPDTVFVVSDHGGGPSNDWVLFMNDWLAAEGFLAVAPKAVAAAGQRLYAQAKKRLSVPARRALRPLFGKALERAKGAALYGDLDWSRSKAYAHMQPAVRLNLEGREPAGAVAESERSEVLDEVAARARDLRLPTGEPAVASVHRAAEIYSDDASGGPDLVMELVPGLHVRSRNTTGRPGFLHRLHDLGMYLPSGLHVRMGMFAAAGSGIEAHGRVVPSDIHQVAPSVLAVMGVPAPAFDFAPLPSVAQALVSAGGRAPADASSQGALEADGHGELDEQEEAEVIERLRGLGYVD